MNKGLIDYRTKITRFFLNVIKVKMEINLFKTCSSKIENEKNMRSQKIKKSINF